jgi:hypothetical protein
LIGLADQLAVKAFFADARFISGDEENCSALWIKCKGNAPYPIIRVKSKFHHVGVTRIIEGVNFGPSQLGTELLQKARQSQGGILHFLWKCKKFQLEFVTNQDRPH